MKYIKNVSTLKLNKEKCIGCGMCEIVCPHRVFTVLENKASINDADLCMECGACKTNCPVSAIIVNAGVGCAFAVINKYIGKKDAECCCSSDTTGECG